ncbi:hypothetical protein ACWGE1_21825 [Streptomyces sp. NPDC054932]
MKLLYTTLLAGTAMAFIGLQGMATAASTGWPSGCTNHLSPIGGGWVAQCSKSNGGHYKASAICEVWEDRRLIIVHSEAWKNDGRPSFIACPPQTSVKTGGIITRSY